MIPGVTYLPVPSITTASDGAVTEVPTATILPSRSRIDAFCIIGPAAVIIVALRMSVVREGNGVYVLGNGLAFGSESAPVPGRPALSRDDAVEVAVEVAVEIAGKADALFPEAAGAVAGAGFWAQATPAAQRSKRLVVRIQRQASRVRALSRHGCRADG